MNKIKELIYFLLLISIYKSIVVIPFKIYQKEEPDNFTADDVINYWENDLIYSSSLIGTPAQKILMIINSETFGTNLYQNMCDIPGSSYSKKNSSTFEIVKFLNNYSMKNSSIINEALYLYNDLNLKEQNLFKYIQIIYSDNEEKINVKAYQSTCINIGLALGSIYYQENPTNLINQLKREIKVIETYDFSIKYNKDNEGEIIIGSEPHIYSPDNYFELQYRLVGALDKKNQNSRDWFLNFDKLYYQYKVKSTGKIINETIGLVKSLRIKFNMGIINGPNEYKELIKRHFFNDLIKEGKCFEKITTDKKTIFFCNKSAESNIQNDFPTLYFEMKQYNKLFELTYKDLFREKNGKFYFLIYFGEYSYGEYFTIGTIFLKKYFFTFNQDTKMIGFYNENLPGGKKNNTNDNSFLIKNKVYLIFIIFVLIIIFGLLGFYLGKLLYDNVRRKRINELDDNYQYNSNEYLNNDDNENYK